jgi:putative redox protein
MIRATTFPTLCQTNFTNGTHSAQADVPLEKDGKGAGFGPHELLEAALATCMTITARKYADKHQLALNSASSEVRLDRADPDHLIMNYTLTLEGELSNEQQQQLRDAVSRCPVKKTLCSDMTFEPGAV